MMMNKVLRPTLINFYLDDQAVLTALEFRQ